MKQLTPIDIKNYSNYNMRLQGGLQDKLFIKDLPKYITTVIDFGCADAALGSALIDLGFNYIGIDNNPKMLSIASETCIKGSFYTNISEIKDLVPSKTAIYFSSVLHEVFTHHMIGFKQFWNEIQSLNLAAICIRDMGLINRYQTVNKDYLTLITDYFKAKYNIGIIQDNISFPAYYQLWLKYFYEENITREFAEDFFSCNPLDVLSCITNYNVSLFQTFTLDFITNKVKEDFNIDPFVSSTHYKLILLNRQNAEEN